MEQTSNDIAYNAFLRIHLISVTKTYSCGNQDAVHGPDAHMP